MVRRGLDEYSQSRQWRRGDPIKSLQVTMSWRRLTGMQTSVVLNCQGAEQRLIERGDVYVCGGGRKKREGR